MGRRDRLHRWGSVAAFVAAVLATTATSKELATRSSEALSGVVRLTPDQRSALVRFIVEVPAEAAPQLAAHEIRLTFPAAGPPGGGEAVVGAELAQGAATGAGAGLQDAVLVGGEHPSSGTALTGFDRCGPAACELETVARFTLVGDRPATVAWTATGVLRLDDDDDVPEGLVMRAERPAPVPAPFRTSPGTWRRVGPGLTVAQLEVDLGGGGVLVAVTPDGASGEVLLDRPATPPVPPTQRGASLPDEAASTTQGWWSGGAVPVVATADRERCEGAVSCPRTGFVVVRQPVRGQDSWWRLDLRVPTGAPAGPVRLRAVPLVELRGHTRLTDAEATARQTLALDGPLAGTTLIGFVDARLTFASSADSDVGGITAELGSPDPTPQGLGERRHYVGDRSPLDPADPGPTQVLARCGSCSELPLVLDWVNPDRTGSVELDWRVVVAAVPADGRARPFTMALR